MEEKENKNVFNNFYEIINVCRALLYKGEYNSLLIKEECEWHLDYHIIDILYKEHKKYVRFPSDVLQSKLFGIKIVAIKDVNEPIQLFKKI